MEASADLAPPASTPVESPRAARMELSQYVGFSWGGAPNGTAQTSFGYVLSDHFVWATGLGFGVSESSGDASSELQRYWSASTGIKVYTRTPEAGTLSPTLRMAVTYRGARRHYAYQDDSFRSREVNHALGGQLTAGLSYFVTDQLAVMVEAGVAGESIVAHDDSTTGGISYSADSGFNVGSTLGVAVVLRR